MEYIPMKRNQKIIAILAAVLAAAGSFSAFTTKADETYLPSQPDPAQNSAIFYDTDREQLGIASPSNASPPPDLKSSVPTFTAEFVESGSPPGLYGTISHFPEDVNQIWVEYSFNGSPFIPDNTPDWKLPDREEEDSRPLLTQLCFASDSLPVRSYNREAVNTLSVRLGLCTDSDEDYIYLDPVTFSHQKEWPLPEKAPDFDASIRNDSDGVKVYGFFTQLPPDACLVMPMYSLDGENYEECGNSWNLRYLGAEDGYLSYLQNQPCLYPNEEPLRSYLEGTLDSFYLKLRITKEKGSSYDTQAAMIEHGEPQAIPEGVTLSATFPSSIYVFERYPFSQYGRYQITISQEASPEEIAAILPKTLPLELQLTKDRKFMTKGTVDCPVTWKPLSLSKLTPGESITIPDAAEEIVIPAGTVLTTPIGSFRLDEDFAMEQSPPPSTDEVRLVLNVVANGEKPSGVLHQDREGLEMAFDLKPTGAAEIQAYTYVNGETEWTKLPQTLLWEAVNAQPSTSNSGYGLILDKDQEPYRSYLAAAAAGDTPVPFLVGLTIRGGVYDGQQLVLPWPDTYQLPPSLPQIGGAGGNEGNAGAGNQDDSTAEGQRPNLPGTDGTEENDGSTGTGSEDTSGLPDTSGEGLPGSSGEGLPGSSDESLPGSSDEGLPGSSDGGLSDTSGGGLPSNKDDPLPEEPDTWEQPLPPAQISSVRTTGGTASQEQSFGSPSLNTALQTSGQNLQQPSEPETTDNDGVRPFSESDKISAAKKEPILPETSVSSEEAILPEETTLPEELITSRESPSKPDTSASLVPAIRTEDTDIWERPKRQEYRLHRNCLVLAAASLLAVILFLIHKKFRADHDH